MLQEGVCREVLQACPEFTSFGRSLFGKEALREHPYDASRLLRVIPESDPRARNIDIVESLLLELPEYGIHIPDFKVCKMSLGGVPCIVFDTERIPHPSSEEVVNEAYSKKVADDDQVALANQTSKLCSSLVSYVYDKAQTGEKMLSDIFRFNQYVFDDEHIMVDLDGRIGELRSDRKGDLIFVLGKILRMIEKGETATGLFTFHARDQIKEIVGDFGLSQETLNRMSNLALAAFRRL